jgi:hypothetical protein
MSLLEEMAAASSANAMQTSRVRVVRRPEKRKASVPTGAPMLFLGILPKTRKADYC